MLLPVRCAVCARPGASPCATCVAGLRRCPPVAAPPGLDACRALLVYDGPARDLVARLKYRNARGSLAWLAGGMARLVAGERVVAVTWAPTSPARRRSRGFDQAELLARRVAVLLGCPCLRLLRRAPDPPQTGRSQADRWQGPHLVALPAARRAAGGAVVVVDDVATTGATLSAAGLALRRAGVGPVIGLVAARTPEPARPRR